MGVAVEYLFVAIGGAFGAISRFAVSNWVAEWLGSTLPYGTFVANITGALFLGFIMTLATEQARVSSDMRLLIATGFIGAYTTFSTFTWESMQLLTHGRLWDGILNIALSLIVGLLAILAGTVLARAIA